MSRPSPPGWPAAQWKQAAPAPLSRSSRSDGRTRWADQPVRRASPIPDEEEDEDAEDDRDPVAENIIRWVPPLTALICAGIALYGFVYYQFFL